MEAAAPPPPPAHRKVNPLAILAISLAVLIVANDFTAVSVALPDMERELDTELETIQWVVNAYALVFGVFIITAGRLADLFGRKEMFYVGAGIFMVFSFLGGLGDEPWMVIWARVAMGFGGAMVWTGALGMIFAEFGPDRAGTAGGIVLGVAGLGNAAGPLIGGALTEGFGWEAIFFVNVPICVAAIAIVAATIKQTKPDRGDARLDYAGTLTLSAALVALLLALDQSSEWGWGDPRIIALLVACPVLLAVFAVIERRAGENALVPASIIGNAAFRSVFFAVLLMSSVFFVSLLYLPQFFQKVDADSPLVSGAAMLPMMLVFGIVSFFSGRLYDRIGPKVIVSTGAALLTIGLFAVSLPGAGSSYLAFVPGLLLLGVGSGLFYSSVTTAGVTALDPSQTSLAGGIVYMAQVAGGAVALGIATTIFTSVAENTVEADAALGPAGWERVNDALLGQGTVTGSLLDLANQAFVDGSQTVFHVFAAVAVIGFLVALFTVGGRLGRGKPTTAETPPASA